MTFMNRLSSSATIILVIFVPVFYFVFFGSFTASMWLVDSEEFAMGTVWFIRIGLLVLFLLFLTLIYFYCMKLKRVEYDQENLYVTNFIQTIKIPFAQVKQFSSRPIGKYRMVKIELLHSGYFGRVIRVFSDVDKLQLFEQITTQ